LARLKAIEAGVIPDVGDTLSQSAQELDTFRERLIDAAERIRRS